MSEFWWLSCLHGLCRVYVYVVAGQAWGLGIMDDQTPLTYPRVGQKIQIGRVLVGQDAARDWVVVQARSGESLLEARYHKTPAPTKQPAAKRKQKRTRQSKNKRRRVSDENS